MLRRNEPPEPNVRPRSIGTVGCFHISFKEKTMLIASLIAATRRYARYRSQLESISQLDERTLRDIGISRGELATAARNLARAQYP
jgi:uncharacterized protein YjiS (DUF1127 family)